MSRISTDLDCARDIITTYHQVNDSQAQGRIIQQTRLFQRNKELEQELGDLKEKYFVLQHALSDRDERLSRLNRQLIDRTLNMARLQEDYENAIYQLTSKKEG